MLLLHLAWSRNALCLFQAWLNPKTANQHKIILGGKNHSMVCTLLSSWQISALIIDGFGNAALWYSHFLLCFFLCSPWLHWVINIGYTLVTIKYIKPKEKKWTNKINMMCSCILAIWTEFSSDFCLHWSSLHVQMMFFFYMWHIIHCHVTYTAHLK